MSTPELSFFARILLAFSAFWRILTDPELAGRFARLSRGEPAGTAVGEPSPAPAREALREQSEDSALQLLGLLQQDGRLVDFLQEDVSTYSDGDIGGAARVVHEGCRKALREHLDIEPVRGEAEGARITLAEGFNAAEVRLTGNLVGKPPFSGSLVHRGWRVTGVRLPRLAEGHEVRVIAPAEVEL